MKCILINEILKFSFLTVVHLKKDRKLKLIRKAKVQNWALPEP